MLNKKKFTIILITVILTCSTLSSCGYKCQLNSKDPIYKNKIYDISMLTNKSYYKNTHLKNNCTL
ncbi:hypothetical protein CONE_0142 [Candidatus Kinetoplastibacterium oncopeltii TCC290E]|uniref:Lipoprotein n=1 Tax=Candidatus Kinetoplastidibacterium stringomonadis TCC290E TaxID=1208920 RepID=M1M9P9_9PROT|nr:hypothetical protein CONE_0142 [Candidatus Kinetoplastibacterium oncopeltii TCC290E]